MLRPFGRRADALRALQRALHASAGADVPAGEPQDGDSLESLDGGDDSPRDEFLVMVQRTHALDALPRRGRDALRRVRDVLVRGPVLDAAPLLAGTWQDLAERPADLACSDQLRDEYESIAGQLWRIRMEPVAAGARTAPARAEPSLVAAVAAVARRPRRMPAFVQHCLERLHQHPGVRSAFPLYARRHGKAAGVGTLEKTPDYSKRQLWLDAAATGGLGVRTIFGWPHAPLARDVRIAVVDFSCDFDHEDLTSTSNAIRVGEEPGDDKGHGTAVAGILLADAQKRARGVTGVVPHARLVWSYPFVAVDGAQHYSVADGIARAALRLRRGDVLLIEQQIQFLPVERQMAEYMAIHAAVRAGIHVIEPAGNGDSDLDADAQMPAADADSGAILVGAGVDPEPARGGTAVLRARLRGNYGSRIHVQGWGDHVFTTASGLDSNVNPDFRVGDNPERGYTSSFSDTSAASAQVAGIVALVSAIQRRLTGKLLSPADMRSLLAATGLPGAGAQSVGALPDVHAALAKVRRGLFAGAPAAALAPVGLTNPELAVLRGLGVGLTDAEIAAKLDLDEATASAQVRNLLARFQTTSKRRCVWMAQHFGLL